MQAVHFVGLPEGDLALAEATVYLALAPKSNALYVGYGEVKSDAQKTVAEPVPLHHDSADHGSIYQGLPVSVFLGRKYNQNTIPNCRRLTSGDSPYAPSDRGLLPDFEFAGPGLQFSSRRSGLLHTPSQESA